MAKMTRLRKLREAIGLTQKEFARIIGIHPSTLCMIETGRVTRPREYIRRRLENFFGLPIGELLKIPSEVLNEKVPSKLSQLILEYRLRKDLKRDLPDLITELKSTESSLGTDFGNSFLQLRKAVEINYKVLKVLETRILNEVTRHFEPGEAS